MHMEQSFVGKVLSNLAIIPPMLAVSSTRYTLLPYLAAFNAALIPAIPAPIIKMESLMESPNPDKPEELKAESSKQKIQRLNGFQKIECPLDFSFL